VICNIKFVSLNTTQIRQEHHGEHHQVKSLRHSYCPSGTPSTAPSILPCHASIPCPATPAHECTPFPSHLIVNNNTKNSVKYHPTQSYKSRRELHSRAARTSPPLILHHGRAHMASPSLRFRSPDRGCGFETSCADWPRWGAFHKNEEVFG
jgi:hypothetical protein